MSPISTDAKIQQYHGNCHCGQFRYRLNIPAIQKVRTCDCSICERNGYMWIFPVAADALVIEQGEDALKSYEFGRRTMAHKFCPKCGTSVMARRHNVPKDRSIGINARSIKDLDLDSLEIGHFPGGDLDPPYEVPKAFDSAMQAEDGKVLHEGNCHCGAVSYTVKTKPFSEIEVMSCNCSLCSRNGDLWIYPSKSAVELRGAEALTDYAFLHEDSLHAFCSICGVSVVVRVTNPKDDIMPINVRTINGIDLGSLKLKKYDGKSNDPQYRV